MSIFGKIVSAIFGGEANASEATSAQAGTPASAPASTGATSTVDVVAILDKLKKESGQNLDWRKSIVDLMKLLKLDSSLTARKALADELKYTGDKSDSASMNIWLHKQVMTKLAANGGVVPKDLQD